MNDGGPAFPIPQYTGETKDGINLQGMSLRDYFAARVMQAAVSAVYAKPEEMIKRDFKKLIVDAAYGIADAMIEKRQSSGDQRQT